MVRHRIRSPGEPDLFSSASLSEAPSTGVKLPRKAPSNKAITTVASPPKYLLPKDLSSGMRRLTDQEFDRLLAAVLAEQKRRGKRPSRKTSHNPLVQDVGPPLTIAKLNAVRAAFKAGVRPSLIARQFGISHADVRKALTRGTSKHSPEKS
jgi:hypothetical protein